VRAVNANGISGQSMLIVVSVVPGGPCDRAGVIAGDTLLEAENEMVNSLDSLAACMLTHARKPMINIRYVNLLWRHVDCLINQACHAFQVRRYAHTDVFASLCRVRRVSGAVVSV
jgi:hypothetical protein